MSECWDSPAGRVRRRVKRHATTRKAMSIEPETTEVTGTDVAEATAVDDAETVTEGQASRADVQLALVEEYTCPICLEVLLRPVSLSCGHRLCRGCWLRVLQGRDVRATANRTGTVACPLGRCQVRPIVPAVDAALARDLEAQFALLLSARVAPTEVDEATMVAEVNAWAAEGCKLDTRDEVAASAAAERADRVERCRHITKMVLWCLLGLLGIVELTVVLVLMSKYAADSREWAPPFLLGLGTIAGFVLMVWCCLNYRFWGPDRAPAPTTTRPGRLLRLLRRVLVACCKGLSLRTPSRGSVVPTPS